MQARDKIKSQLGSKMPRNRAYKGMIVRYVRWQNHDACGTLPQLDVVAGVLSEATWRRPHEWAELSPDECLVIVPPQWIGDWEDGRPLPPAYQHVWRVTRDHLLDLPDATVHPPYRPVELPPTARGIRFGPYRRRPS